MGIEEVTQKLHQAQLKQRLAQFTNAINNIVLPPMARSAEQLSFFSIVRYALDRSLEQYLRTHPHATLENTLQKIAKLQRYIRERWRDEYSPPSLNYHDPLLRMAYMLSYSATHAATVTAILQELKLGAHVEVGEKGVFRVCSYGGGPGTELLSVTRHLYEYSLSAQDALKGFIIDFTTFDSERDWLNSWKHLRNGLLHSLPDGYFKGITGDFALIDLRNRAEVGHYEDIIHRAELHIFSYVFSELRFNNEDFQATLERIVDIARHDTGFLIIDANYPTANQYIQNSVSALSRKVNIKWLKSQYREGRMKDFGENVNMLKHWNGYGNYPFDSPQLKWNAHYILIVKP